MTILIVDDEPLCRVVLRVGFTKAGYDVVEATDGLDAVRVLERPGQHIDAVVTDLMMPRMSGLELLQHIRQVPALASIPAVVCSARSPGADTAPLTTLGIAAYLVKPFNIRAVIAALHGRNRLDPGLPF